MSVRVRYAPSPTGRQHVGNVRTALFAYLLARSTGGTFVLRIEDTDRRRFDPAALQEVYDTLTWLGLRWDEGPDVGGPYAPYVQSERLDRYRAVAERLVQAGHAYRCTCGPERLERVRAAGSGYDRHCRNLTAAEREEQERRGGPAVIRFKVPLEGATRYDDLLLGSIERHNRDINPDPVLLKSDGFPTYHLAAITDDHEMRISHVLRSQEWVSSAPLHLLIFQACGWQPPHYAHLPAVNGPDGKKLGKRHGATGVGEFRSRGFLPQALVNYLALLGWSAGDDRELFSLAELEGAFSLERLGRAGAVFDHRKLEWFNGQYIRMLSPQRLAEAVAPYLQAAGLELADPGQAAALAELLRERLAVLDEAPARAAFLGADRELPAAELVPKRLTAAQAAGLLRGAAPLLEEPPQPADEPALEERLRELAATLGVKFGDLMMTIRLAATGSRVSPPLFGSLRLLGAARVRRRLATALVTVEAAAVAASAAAGAADASAASDAAAAAVAAGNAADLVDRTARSPAQGSAEGAGEGASAASDAAAAAVAAGNAADLVDRTARSPAQGSAEGAGEGASAASDAAAAAVAAGNAADLVDRTARSPAQGSAEGAGDTTAPAKAAENRHSRPGRDRRGQSRYRPRCSGSRSTARSRARARGRDRGR